jgi:hypothetical protein
MIDSFGQNQPGEDNAGLTADDLPRGTIVRRKIRGADRFYHQWRENGVTKSRYLSPGEIMPLRAQLERRKRLAESGNAKAKGPLPSDFRCDVLTGSFLAEFAASADCPRERDCFAELSSLIHGQMGRTPPSESKPPFVVGTRSVGKTTLLRQLIHALPPAHRAKAAYLRLTGAETPAEVTADLNALRDLGFRAVFIDDAHHLAGLAGTGLLLVLAGTSVPAALNGQVASVDISFIPFGEYARLTGETDPLALVERGGTLAADPGTAEADPASASESLRRNDRFVLDVLALAALRAKDEVRARGETFLGTDLQKLRNRFVEISSLTDGEDASARESLLGLPTCLRYRHARARIEGLLEDPILDRLGAAERKIVRDLLLDEMRLRLLEDAVWNELRHARRPLPAESQGQSAVKVHRVPFAPGAYGFVVADADELTCEVVLLTTDSARDPVHLRYIDDPARLDVLEHRYGTVTARTVLYNGRDARLSSGVSYRNLAKYLAGLR